MATGLLNIRSDDFSSNTGHPDWTGTLPPSPWAWDDSPSNDCTLSAEGHETGDARAVITVPTGTSHEGWTTWTAPYLRQATTSSTGDFVMECKIDAIPFSGSAYQENGIVAWTDNSSVKPIISYYRDNGTYGLWFGNAAAGGGGWGTAAPGLVSPIWLRIGRVSGAWTGYYSSTGSSFTTLGTDANEAGVRSANLNYVGVFAGNTSGAPTFNAKFDYFWETTAPISPEDEIVGGATRRIFIIS